MLVPGASQQLLSGDHRAASAKSGLRRALGARRGQIRLQFLTESVTLSALGGVTGVALGLAVSIGWALNHRWPLTLPACQCRQV
ncbi:ABC transporter permease [Streptomyces tubercidicus]|uniref:ABC transporter permease n=1 Tax=Streptomyces tubercidicus TaxID=47759 RepID=UPI003466A44C